MTLGNSGLESSFLDHSLDKYTKLSQKYLKLKNIVSEDTCYKAKYLQLEENLKCKVSEVTSLRKRMNSLNKRLTDVEMFKNMNTSFSIKNSSLAGQTDDLKNSVSLTHDGIGLGSTNPESKFSQPQIGSDNGEPMVSTRDETLRYKKILGNYKLDLKGIKELTNILMLKDKQVVQLQERIKSLTVSQCEYIGQIKEYDLLLGQFKNDLLGKDNL